MRTKSFDDDERKGQQEVERAIRIFDQSVEWFRQETFSRSYGRIELGVAVHDGTIKTVYRTVKEHVDEVL
jgi:hypothetical protein